MTENNPNCNYLLLIYYLERLQEVAEECEFKGAKCYIIAADIKDYDTLKEVLEDFDNQHPIDLLFANAGWFIFYKYC